MIMVIHGDHDGVVYTEQERVLLILKMVPTLEELISGYGTYGRVIQSTYLPVVDYDLEVSRSLGLEFYSYKHSCECMCGTHHHGYTFSLAQIVNIVQHGHPMVSVVSHELINVSIGHAFEIIQRWRQSWKHTETQIS